MDIKYTDTADIDLTMGDIVYTDATAQHQLDALATHKGLLKSKPEFGAGIDRYLLDNSPSDMLMAAKANVEMIGQKVAKIGYANGKITMEAGYVDSKNR